MFLGSHFSDSVLLSTVPSLTQVQTVITNLATISDFLILPPSHPQAGTLITCSGGFGQGTLRIVRQGVGLEDYASVDFEGIRGLWTVNVPRDETRMEIEGGDVVLVLGLIQRSVFLEVDKEGGLEAIPEFQGLISNEESISVHMVGERIIQVTTERVHVVSRGIRVGEFIGKISAAKIGERGILVSCGRDLILLNSNCGRDHEWTFLEEITSLDYLEGSIIAVGLWNGTFQLIPLATKLPTQFTETLSSPARSILISTILPTTTLLIGSRDGVLTTYSLPNLTHPTLKDKKVISLGTQPLHLIPLQTHSQNLIFASSDRPTVFHVPSTHSPSKFSISAFSTRDVLALTPLHHEAYPDGLVIATKEGFRIGKLDQMTRLQVRTVTMPNNELPRRITRIDSTETGMTATTGGGLVGVISLKVSVDIDGSDKMEGYFRVWDEDSWQCSPFKGVVDGRYCSCCVPYE